MFASESGGFLFYLLEIVLNRIDSMFVERFIFRVYGGRCAGCLISVLGLG